MSILGKISGLEKDVFGLDIGYENLKVVQLKKAGSLFKLEHFGSISSPKQPFTKNIIKDKKTLATTIKKAVSDFNISAKAIVSALPESLVFTKIIQMPKMKMEELQTAVPIEAASFIPLEPAQTYLDFQIVDETQENLEILVVAAPKSLVSDFIDTVRQVGLYLICLETKPLANIRALIKPAEKEGFLIADIGAEATSLTIYDAGAMKFTATYPMGGGVFTRTIASGLSITQEKAEEMKKKIGITKEGERIKQALNEPLGSLVDEMAAALKFYQSRKEKTKISKIILAGGGASMPGLCGFLEDKIGLKTELGNPWQAVKNPPKTEESLQYTTAIGLAMRQI